MSETVGQLWSTFLGNERRIWIREPAQPHQPCRLAIFLDGEFYRDGVGAGPTIDALEAAGQIANTRFVFVSMHSPEARWVESPCYPPFADFVQRELLPWIEAKYPAVKATTERALIGLSYTGLAAAYVALKVPGLFSHVIAQSGSFWWHDCWLVEQYRQLDGRLPTAFYLDVGRQETEQEVSHQEDVHQGVSQIDGVEWLRDALLAHGHAVEYVLFDGGHDFAAWKATLPGALRWALPAKTAPG